MRTNCSWVTKKLGREKSASLYIEIVSRYVRADMYIKTFFAEEKSRNSFFDNRWTTIYHVDINIVFVDFYYYEASLTTGEVFF